MQKLQPSCHHGGDGNSPADMESWRLPRFLKVASVPRECHEGSRPHRRRLHLSDCPNPPQRTNAGSDSVDSYGSVVIFQNRSTSTAIGAESVYELIAGVLGMLLSSTVNPDSRSVETRIV